MALLYILKLTLFWKKTGQSSPISLNLSSFQNQRYFSLLKS